MCHACRWSGEGQLLEVAAGEDPLACLQLQADAADALLLGGQQGAASGPQLVLTPEVRSQLAMLAPWLHSKEPFLLVRAGYRGAVCRGWFSTLCSHPSGPMPLVMCSSYLTQSQSQNMWLGCVCATPMCCVCHAVMGSQHAAHPVLTAVPVMQVGPEGCGKNSLLQHCFAALPPGVVVACVACSAQTTSTTIIQKLMQVGAGAVIMCTHVNHRACFLAITMAGTGCVLQQLRWWHAVGIGATWMLLLLLLLQVCGKPVTTRAGKTLRPDTGRVILYLKDINLPK